MSLSSTSRRRSDPGLALLGILAAVVLWQVAALAMDNPIALPTFTSVVAELATTGTDAEMRGNVADTLWRVTIGFTAGSAIGVAVGSLIGAYGPMRTILNPYLNFLRSIAPIAWIVPATIWLGVGQPSILFVIVYAAVFPAAINTISGMAGVAPDKIRMGRMFGLSPLGVLLWIRMPDAVPQILTGLRIGLGLSFMAVIGAEMLIGRSGIGFAIYEGRTTFATTSMFAGILLLGMVGYLGDLAFAYARNRTFKRFYAGRVDA